MDVADLPQVQVLGLGLDSPRLMPPRVNWRTIRLTDCDIPAYVRSTIYHRLGLTITLGALDAMSDDDLKSEGEKRSTQTPRWLGVVRDQIAQSKLRYPDPRAHVDIPRMPEINYALLGEAIAFYKARGYDYVEAPWAVSEASVAITCPNPAFSAHVPDLGALVGSAEQSFLHLDLQKKLGTGRFVACTPCFRLGDDQGDHHFPTFMKVELYQNGEASMVDLLRMIGDAGACFRALGADPGDMGCPSTEEGWDITLNDLEIGSYGARTHTLEDGSYHFWLYGTGLALPRFEQALTGTPPRN